MSKILEVAVLVGPSSKVKYAIFLSDFVITSNLELISILRKEFLFILAAIE